MNTFFFATNLLFLFLLNAWSTAEEVTNDNETISVDFEVKLVNGSMLRYLYWNSNLGNNKSVEFNIGNLSSIVDYWIADLPLKVITHGWLQSDVNSSGVFIIKTAYVATGGYNVITVDWNSIANNILYPVPAFLTTEVGSVIAEFLDHLVDILGINGSDIHLIGHSLGAHIVGSCGSHFKSGKIGRITGLDPAGPGFETFKFIQDNNILRKENADFVDIIHTDGGVLGFLKSIGHADFYPNNGQGIQPLCQSQENYLLGIFCSHFTAFEYYANTIYHRKSLIGTKCSSWIDYVLNKCRDNKKVAMGHDTKSTARGDFFLTT